MEISTSHKTNYTPYQKIIWFFLSPDPLLIRGLVYLGEKGSLVPLVTTELLSKGGITQGLIKTIFLIKILSITPKIRVYQLAL